MDTQKLIDDLSHDLTPVRPLMRPAVRALVFAGSILLPLALLASFGALRADAGKLAIQPHFIYETLLLLATGFLSSLAAFILAVPDIKIRKPVMAAIYLSTALLALMCFFYCSQSISPPSFASGFHCARDLLFIAALPVALGSFMLTKSSPVWFGLAGYCLVLSVAAFSGVAMRLLCPNDEPAHILYWHFLPALGFGAAGIILGKTIFTFKQKKEKRT